MNTYDKKLILALEEINNAEYGCRFTTTADLLDNLGNYALYENCETMREVIEMRFKEEWELVIPEDIEDYFDWDKYIEMFAMGSGEWFETEYGMVERLI